MMKTILLLTFCMTTTYAQSVVGDNWRVDPDTYEEIVIGSVKGELAKEKRKLFVTEGELDKGTSVDSEKSIEPAFGGTFDEPSKDSWQKEKVKENNNWLKENKKKEQQWIKDKKKILEKWSADKIEFNKNIKRVKKYLIPAKTLKREKVQETPKSSGLLKSSTEEVVLLGASSPPVIKQNILSKTFALPIRHQGERSTCAAFASVRAMEINLFPKRLNLSEQLFFYLSRADCQKNKCSLAGSWARVGLEALAKQTAFMTEEKHCPYRYEVKPENITHLPLKESCFNGKYFLKNYTSINKVENIYEEVKNRKPTIMGFYVDDQFLVNDGLISMGLKKGKKIEKQYAHTVLAIGSVPLPKELHQTEGDYCHLVVNSWGSGWGIGGYSCLTKKWIESHIIENPSISVGKVSRHFKISSKNQ
jgi:C1A family cysteine protease